MSRTTDDIVTIYPAFWPAVQHNLIWLGFLVVFPTILGMLLAVVLDREMKGSRLYQTAFYMPVEQYAEPVEDIIADRHVEGRLVEAAALHLPVEHDSQEHAEDRGEGHRGSQPDQVVLDRRPERRGKDGDDVVAGSSGTPTH